MILLKKGFINNEIFASDLGNYIQLSYIHFLYLTPFNLCQLRSNEQDGILYSANKWFN